MAHYRDEALVLRTYKLGEADRIVVLFGRTRGKIRAVGKGVRRTKSKFGARLEPGSLIHAQFYEGRNLDIVTQAETAHRFDHLRSDIDRHSRAMIILEIAEQVALEGQGNPALFKTVTGALKELDRSGNATVLPALVGKVLMLEGVQPQIDRCVVCGTVDAIESIDITQGGALCHNHRQGEPMSGEAQTALALIFQGRIREVLNGTDKSTVREIESLSTRIMEHHLERRLKAAHTVPFS